MVALIGYNAIQISLYGLVGTTIASLLGGGWQLWAGVIWLVVGALGLLGGALGARILGSLLALELGVIACFIVTAFAHPAGGRIPVVGMAPSHLLVSGFAGVLAFGMAAFVGVETPPAYGEEARPGAAGRAMAVAVGFLGSFYLLAAWAFQAWAGVTGTADPANAPLALLGDVFGPGVVDLATLLLVTSIIASMLAFHAAVARYIFAMAREGALPTVLARVSPARRRALGGAPIGGSLVQSATAAVVLAAFIAVHADPMAVVFVWLSTIGAVAILGLLVAAALAARWYFYEGFGADESWWIANAAPVAGAVAGVIVIAMMVANLGHLLGTPTGSWLPLLVPALIVVGALVGACWGLVLRRRRFPVWDKLGKGTPDPITVNDARLGLVKV
jgi:amino acid transporter